MILAPSLGFLGAMRMDKVMKEAIDKYHRINFSGRVYDEVTEESIENDKNLLQKRLAVVPEPISSILFVTSSAVLAGKRYLRKEKAYL